MDRPPSPPPQGRGAAAARRDPGGHRAAAPRDRVRRGGVDPGGGRRRRRDPAVDLPALRRQDHLIFEVCARHFSALDDSMAEACEGIDDPVDGCVALGRAYMRFGVANPEPYRIVFMTRPDATPEDFTGRGAGRLGRFDGCRAPCRTASTPAGFPSSPTPTACHRVWARVHGLTSLLVAKPGHALAGRRLRRGVHRHLPQRRGRPRQVTATRRRGRPPVAVGRQVDQRQAERRHQRLDRQVDDEDVPHRGPRQGEGWSSDRNGSAPNASTAKALSTGMLTACDTATRAHW